MQCQALLFLTISRFREQNFLFILNMDSLQNCESLKTVFNL